MIILNHSVSSDEENDSALDLSISSSRQKSPADTEVDKPSYKLKKSMIRRYCKSDESFFGLAGKLFEEEENSRLHCLDVEIFSVLNRGSRD